MGNYMVKTKSKALLLGLILNFFVTSCAFGDFFDSFKTGFGLWGSSGTVAKAASASGTAYGLVWGVNASGQIYFREGISQDNPQGTSWTQIDGGLTWITVGPQGLVYGVNSNGQTYCRQGITQTNPKGTGWTQIPGQLRPVGGIAAGPNGQVWGVGPDSAPDGGNIYIINGATPSNPAGSGWTQIDAGSHISYIAVGPSGIPVGIQNNINGGKIWWRLPNGWTPAEGGALKQMSIGLNNYIWGVNNGNAVYVRTGTSASNAYGNGWANIPGNLSNVSIGARGATWGVNSNGYIYIRTGVTETYPGGNDWLIDPDPNARLVQVAVGPWLSDLPAPTASVTASANSFSASAPGLNDMYPTWDAAWKLPKSGEGQISFNAQTTNDVMVAISPTQNNGTTAANRTPMYEINIGGWGNTRSVVRRSAQGPALVGGPDSDSSPTAWNTARVPASAASTPAAFTISIKQNGTTSVTITVTGAVDAHNNPVTLTYTDTSPILNTQYVSFSSWNVPTTYSNITIAAPAAVPVGWTEEGDAAQVVAVGSDNGQTTGWAIQVEANAQGQNNGVLYRYNNGNMDLNPWTEETVKDASGNVISDLADVSAASDGTVCVVSAIGQVLVGGTTTMVNDVPTTTGGKLTPAGGVIYEYDAKANHWVALPTKNDQNKPTIMFETVAVGNKNNIWATEANTDNCYQLVNGVWVLRSNTCVDVSVGLDGTVYAINTVHNVFKYLGDNKWSEKISYKDASGTEQILQLTQISVGSADYMYGINNTNGTDDLWAWNKVTKNWSRPSSTAGTLAGGFVTVGCNAAGTVMASDHDDMWISDQGGVTIDAKTADKPSIKAQPSGKVSKRTEAKKSGTVKTTPEAKKAAKAAKASKKAEQAKASAAAVATAKTAVVKGKKVKVDSKGNVIQTTPKVVGKKARVAKTSATKAAATTPATASATTPATTPETKPAKAKKPAKPAKATKASAAKAARAGKPAKKSAMVRQ